MVFSTVLVILAFTNIIHPSYFSITSQNTSSGNINPGASSIDLNSLNKTSQEGLGQSGSLGNPLPSLNILPSGVLDNALNLSAHFFLMAFIGGFGYKLAMIGVNLIRPIVIKTGDKIYETAPPQI